MYDLSVIQNQLDILKSSMQATASPVRSSIATPSTVSKDDIRNIVKEILREELVPSAASLGNGPNPLFMAVGKVLTEEEQVFLTKHITSFEKDFISFLETDDGKLSVQSYMMFIKEKYK